MSEKENEGLPPYNILEGNGSDHNKLEKMEGIVSSLKDDQKNIVDSIRNVIGMVNDQSKEHKAQSDKLLNKIDQLNKERTRSRNVSKQSENKHYRSTSNPESSKDNKDSKDKWHNWFSKKKESNESNLDNKELYPDIVVNNEQGNENMESFENSKAFVRNTEPATPVPFNIKKLHVAMPGTKEKTIDIGHQVLQNRSYAAEFENYVDDEQYRFLTQDTRADELINVPKINDHMTNRGYNPQLGARPKNMSYATNRGHITEGENFATAPNIEDIVRQDLYLKNSASDAKQNIQEQSLYNDMGMIMNNNRVQDKIQKQGNYDEKKFNDMHVHPSQIVSNYTSSILIFAIYIILHIIQCMQSSKVYHT